MSYENENCHQELLGGTLTPSQLVRWNKSFVPNIQICSRNDLLHTSLSPVQNAVPALRQKEQFSTPCQQIRWPARPERFANLQIHPGLSSSLFWERSRQRLQKKAIWGKVWLLVFHETPATRSAGWFEVNCVWKRAEIFFNAGCMAAACKCQPRTITMNRLLSRAYSNASWWNDHHASVLCEY